MLSGEATSDAGLDATQVPGALAHVTSYIAAELRTFHCENVRKMPLSGLDPSMLIEYLQDRGGLDRPSTQSGRGTRA